MKFFAVSAALCCAGGAAIADHGGSASSAPVAPAAVDHYLCVGDSGTWCIPARTTLPDGTSFGVSDANDRIVCTPVRNNSRDRRSHDTTTVAVTNEFSGPTPVPLAVGPARSTCTLAPRPGSNHHFSRSRASNPTAVYACSAAGYPANPATRFNPPFPVKVGDRFQLRILDPSRLCVPVPPATPTVAPAAVTAGPVLVCFDVSVANRPRRFAPDLLLCVPSNVGGVATSPPNSTTTSSTKVTTTTAKPTTTTSSTTTTTRPVTTTTARPTTTTSSTTTTSTTTSTTTTTTTGGGTQPCAGILINGVCILNL